MNLKDVASLWKAARTRLNSETDYHKFQAFQASLLLEHFRKHGISISESRVLDLGSGIGGYSNEFVRNSAQVLSIDFFHPRGTHSTNPFLIQASALKIPLTDESIDFIFCASLIEHLAEPAHLLSETSRVLKPSGTCYVSFPPYFSPRGGHEFSPFHYLGESLAMRMINRDRKIPDWVRQFYNVPLKAGSFRSTYDGFGLYQMTIHKFRNLVKDTDLIIFNSSTRYFPISFVRWPIIGEVLTWHAQFLLRKRSDTGDTSP